MSFAALSIISGVIGAVGSVLSGVAAASAAKEREAIAKLNQETSLLNAARAVEAGQLDTQDQDFLTLSLLGSQEGAQSASGLSTGTGSPALARKTARELGRKDALNVTQAAKVRQFNFRVEAENQASIARQEANLGGSALLQGFIGGVTSLVGGATAARTGPTPRFNPLQRRT